MGCKLRIRSVMLCAAGAVLLASGVGAQVPDSQLGKFVVKDKVRELVRPFDLNQVKLLDGPFKHAMDLDSKYLLLLEPDRFLSTMRTNAGLKAKAEPYGGWESGNLAGEMAGHYLTACSLMYRSTGDKRFLERVNYIVDQMAEIQKANGSGFIGGMPNANKLFVEMKAAKTPDELGAAYNSNKGGVPWYNIHKTFAGLRDAYVLCDNQKAKQVLSKFADWVYDWQNGIPENVFQAMLDIEHGGINESLAETYSITGNPKHIAAARRFYHKKMLTPLTMKQDKLEGNHANTQIPKMIGAARLFELTNTDRYKTIASFFWDTVIKNHTYVIGGNSCYEYFGPAGKLADRLAPNTTETCNTYNMLKLTRHLFSWTADPKYADYYERAIYNHILASQSSETGMMCYYVPLKTGRLKKFSTEFESFWCCVGTGIENHAKYGDSIYFHNDNELYVNLFIPSVLNWTEKGIKITQETDFPKSDTMKFTVSCSKPAYLPIIIRHPGWAIGSPSVSVNGEQFPPVKRDDGYFVIGDTWNNGDVIEVQIPMHLYTESVPDNKSILAVLYGPIVLAGKLSRSISPFEQMTVMVTNDKRVDDWVEKVTGKLEFKTRGVGKPDDVTLVPFYEINDDPYTVYWDTFTDEGWVKLESEYKEKKRQEAALEASTLDYFALGEMQPERDHNFRSEKSRIVDKFGKKGREADPDGWFEFEMKVLPDQQNKMVCTYWGFDYWKEFRIMVEGKEIAKQPLLRKYPDLFFNETYTIPLELTKGKDKVTVRFQKADWDSIIGVVYGCRTVR